MGCINSCVDVAFKRPVARDDKFYGCLLPSCLDSLKVATHPGPDFCLTDHHWRIGRDKDDIIGHGCKKHIKIIGVDRGEISVMRSVRGLFLRGGCDGGI